MWPAQERECVGASFWVCRPCRASHVPAGHRCTRSELGLHSGLCPKTPGGSLGLRGVLGDPGALPSTVFQKPGGYEAADQRGVVFASVSTPVHVLGRQLFDCVRGQGGLRVS